MELKSQFDLETAQPNAAIKVIIVHEDTLTGIQAVDILQRLAVRLGSKMGLEINPWRFITHAWKFELLQDPQWWADAVARSVEADLIIVASGWHREFPTFVRSWIESALPRRLAGSGTLVALLDAPNGAGSGVLSPAKYLRQLTERYGISFLCSLDSAQERLESGMDAVLSQWAEGLPNWRLLSAANS